jgi:hypothetical protein
VPLLDRRSAACVSAMAGIYHRLLGRIEHAGFEARNLDERPSVIDPSGNELVLDLTR